MNTLVLTVFERTREIGMLRAIGMTRRQVRRMIRHESVITALIGGVLGIVLGIVLGALLVARVDFIDFSLPVASAHRLRDRGDHRRDRRGDLPGAARGAAEPARSAPVRVSSRQGELAALLAAHSPAGDEEARDLETMRVYAVTLGDWFSRDEPVAQVHRVHGRGRRRGGARRKQQSPSRARAHARTREGGSPCGRVTVTPNAPYCAHHTALAEEAAGGAGTRKKRRPLRVVGIESAESEQSVSVSGNDADPATIRPRLARAAAENVEQLQASLLEAAGSAVRPVWITVECEGAGVGLWLLAGDPVVVGVEPLVERHRAEVEGGASPEVRHRPTHHHAGCVLSAHLPDAVRIPGVQLSAVLIAAESWRSPNRP